MTQIFKQRFGVMLSLLISYHFSSSCFAEAPNKVKASTPANHAVAPSSTAGAAAFTRMSDFYAKLSNFSFTAQPITVVKQGATQEKHSADYQMRFSKPLCFAVDVDRGKDVDKTLARLDSKVFYVNLPGKGYLKHVVAGEAVTDRTFRALADTMSREQFLLGSLGMAGADSPLKFYSKVKGFSVQSIKLIGVEKIGKESAKHVELISIPQIGLHWDLWIQEGASPWLLKSSVHVASVLQKADMECTTEFSNWQNNLKFADGTFEYTPPAGAKELKAPADAAASDLIGKPAPQLVLHTIGGGNFDVADSKGKDIVVLDFWATWCPPCRAALPILAEVTSSYASKGVKFCAVDMAEDPVKVKKFLDAEHMTFTVGLDSDGKAARAYSVSGIPRTVLIGKDGLVKFVHEGYSSQYKQSLTEELDTLVAPSTAGVKANTETNSKANK